MATPVFFYPFTEKLAEDASNYNFDTNTLKVLLSNTAPDATADEVKTDVSEISAGFGYTAGGFDVQNATSRTTTITTVTAVNVTVTASGGSIGPYRYVVLYNDSSTSDDLICYWDKGTSVTLTSGQTDLLDFGGYVLRFSTA